MVREEAVVDLIDVGEVIGGGGGVVLAGGLAGGDVDTVGVVDADFVHEDSVEADGFEVGGLFYGA